MMKMALPTKLRNATGVFCLFYWVLSVGHLHAEGLPNPKLLGVWPGYTRGPARSVDVSGNHIYAALAGGGFAVCEIIDETNIVRINTQDLVESAALQVVGNLAYVAASGDGLKIFDVSNPTNLVQVGSFGGIQPTGISLVGSLAFLADAGNGLYIIDVSSPVQPKLAGFYPAGIPVGGSVVVTGGLAYFPQVGKGLVILDVSVPAQPVQVGAFSTSEQVNDVALAGDHAYIATGLSGLQILDVSNPTNIVRLGAYADGRFYSYVKVAGSVAYMGSRSQELVVLDVSNPTNINRLAAYQTQVNCLVFTGTKAVVAAGDGGLQLLDLSDPTRPTLMAKIGTSASGSQVVVTNGLAYLADQGGGLQVLDIHDPTQIRPVGNYLGSSAISGVDVANGLAGVLESGRVTILDVRDPQNISQIGSYLSFYPTAIRLVGRRAYVAGFNDLAILDLSQPGQVLTLGTYPSQQLFYDMDVSGDIICAVSQPAPGGVFIFDGSNPTNIALLAIHPGLEDISHRAWGYVGVRFFGDLIFASTDTYGLEVLNVENLQQPFSLGNSLLPYPFGRLYPFGSWACAPSFGRLVVLDVRSPNHVTVEYQQDVQGGASSVFVEGDRVYVASQRRGLAVYGLDNALRLTIAKLSSNLYSLSWDALSVRLEVTTDLSNPVWQTVEGSTTANSIMRTTANASEFYRLVYTPPN